MAKINIFFAEKLAEAQRNYSTLSDELGQSTKAEKSKKGVRFKGFGSDEVPGRKLQDLKLAFSEYYLSLVLLQNYQNLNFTGTVLYKRIESVLLLIQSFLEQVPYTLGS